MLRIPPRQCQRHAGQDRAILATRHARYLQAKEQRYSAQWPSTPSTRQSSTRLPALHIFSRKLRDSGDNWLDARRYGPRRCSRADGRPQHQWKKRAFPGGRSAQDQFQAIKAMCRYGRLARNRCSPRRLPGTAALVGGVIPGTDVYVGIDLAKIRVRTIGRGSLRSSATPSNSWRRSSWRRIG